MDPLVALVRRYVDDWLNAADPSVCEEILDPDYTLHIGGHVLAGRDDAYVPATMGQLRQFPDMVVTVHDLLVAHDRVAMHFSERGSSTRHDGRTAGWAGIVLFRWDGHRLTEAFVEEDYLSRRAQLADAQGAQGEQLGNVPPGYDADLWDQGAVDPDPRAEAVVRRWLREGDAGGDVAYDDRLAGDAEPLLDVAEAEVHELFSAGSRVAFHATQRGVDVAGDAFAELHSAGIVEVDGSRVAGGHVIRDRLGLQRALRDSDTQGDNDNQKGA